MQLQKQPNPATCLITSFAMVLDIPVQKAIEIVAHDGMDFAYIKNNFVEIRRGHHIQEMVDLCFKYKYVVCGIEALPVFRDYSEVFKENKIRLTNYLQRYSGVFTGLAQSSKRHAVAWDHKTNQIYDPNGTIYVPEKDVFSIESFWLVIRME